MNATTETNTTRKRVRVVLCGQSGSVQCADRVLVDRVLDSQWSRVRVLRHWQRKYPHCVVTVELV